MVAAAMAATSPASPTSLTSPTSPTSFPLSLDSTFRPLLLSSPHSSSSPSLSLHRSHPLPLSLSLSLSSIRLPTTATATAAAIAAASSSLGGVFLDALGLYRLQTLDKYISRAELGGGWLEIRHMEDGEVDPTVQLLAESFAESMGMPPRYVPLLAFLVRQYVVDRRFLVPHAAMLVGFYCDGDREPELVCTAEVSFDARGAIAAPPTPLPPRGCPYICNMAVKKELRRVPTKLCNILQVHPSDISITKKSNAAISHFYKHKPWNSTAEIRISREPIQRWKAPQNTQMECRRGIGFNLLKACEELISKMKTNNNVYLHCRVTDTGPFKMYKKAKYRMAKTDSILVWLTLQRRKHLLFKVLDVMEEATSASQTDITVVDYHVNQ